MQNPKDYNSVVYKTRSTPAITMSPELYEKLSKKIKGSSILVIGGAGSIGSATLMQILRHKPKLVHVVDRDENSLARCTRYARVNALISKSTHFTTFPTDYASDIFLNWIASNKFSYDFILNFSALKHVRSEKDPYTCAAILENNVTKFYHFLKSVDLTDTERVFSVSTDKAANSTSIMGISKKLMEKMMFSVGLAEQTEFTSARFANVAFSQGSLLENWLERLANREPLSCPIDCERYFITLEEAGHICMVAAFLAVNKSIMVPKFSNTKDLVMLQSFLHNLLTEFGVTPKYLFSEKDLLSQKQIEKSDQVWPVLMTPLDTKGEKAFEEFVGKNELLTNGPVPWLETVRHDKSLSSLQCEEMIGSLNNIFAKSDLCFGDVHDLISRYEYDFMSNMKTSSLSLDDRI